MSRQVAIALSTIVVAATPAVVAGNAAWVLANPWLVDAVYALPGFPDGREGVTEPTRTSLAKLGVRAVRPGGEGIVLLERAQRPDGSAAFAERELHHMRDVRELLGGLLVGWIVAVACGAIAALALACLGPSGAARQALFRGGQLTLALALVIGLAMVVAFEAVFDGFHGIAFEGRSWRFADRYTLRQLYPDAFWQVAGAALGALVLAQAAALTALARGRRADRDAASTRIA